MYTNIELLTKELKKVGFNKYRISKMVLSGELIRLSRGHYLVNSYKDLRSIGEKCLELGEEELGYEVLSVYFSYEPNDFDLAYVLFKIAIKNKEYTEAVPYFKSIYDNSGNLSKKEKNLLLHVFGTIVHLPKKYQDKDNNLTFRDVKSNNTNKNNLRSLILNDKFDKALELIDGYSLEELTGFDMLLKELLTKALLCKNKRSDKFLALAMGKQYDKLASILYSMEDQGKLSDYMLHALYIVEDILDMEETKKIPAVRNTKGNQLFGLIEGGSYYEALELCKKTAYKYGSLDDNLIYILLNDITGQIEKFKREENITKIIDQKLKDPYNVYSDEAALERKSKELLGLFLHMIDDRGMAVISSLSNTVRKGIGQLVEKSDDLISFPVAVRGNTPALVVQRVYKKEIRDEFKDSANIKLIEALTSKGIAEYNNGEYNKCIKTMKKVLLFGKADDIVYHYLGEAFQSKGYLYEAINFFIVTKNLHKKQKLVTPVQNEIKFNRKKMDSSIVLKKSLKNG